MPAPIHQRHNPQNSAKNRGRYTANVRTGAEKLEGDRIGGSLIKNYMQIICDNGQFH